MLRITVFLALFVAGCWSESDGSNSNLLFHIEGKITPPDPKPKDWFWTTQIHLDGGKRIGYIKDDNTFVIDGLPTGSYLIEVMSPDFVYEPVRVDINSKGKVRARKVNNVQPTQVTTVPYPLKMKPLGRQKYFETREEWKITDMLMNPMVLMMIMPLLLITVLPNMMNDPETKREMEQMQQQMSTNNQVPDLSDMLSTWLGGGGNEKQKKKPDKRSSSRR